MAPGLSAEWLGHDWSGRPGLGLNEAGAEMRALGVLARGGTHRVGNKPAGLPAKVQFNTTEAQCPTVVKRWEQGAAWPKGQGKARCHAQTNKAAD